MSAFEALLARLVSARRAGVRFELSRVRACLDALGAPDRQMRCLQVGGTNGKGSTAAFAESILRHAGRRTGRFSSPHLSRLGERIAIDGREATRAELVRAGAAVEAVGGEALTFFEQLLCMGLWLFAEAEVEVAVLEVGLGGRLDATTAADIDAAALTGVALDHQDYLGTTLSDIAAEKAAIFRRERPAIIGASGEEDSQALLRGLAMAAGAEPILCLSPRPALPPLGLPGAYQRDNAAVGVALCEALAGLEGSALEPGAVRAGLAATRLPGRLEDVPGSPGWLLDVAHNPHAARQLAAELGSEEFVIVLGVSADKDLEGIVTPLLPRCRAVVATRAVSDRALDPEAIATCVTRLGGRSLVAPDVAAALELARTLCRCGDRALVCGSVFVVGEARALLTGEHADPVLTSDPLGLGPGR